MLRFLFDMRSRRSANGFVWLVFIAAMLASCTKQPASQSAPETPPLPLAFPQDWEGDWQGNLTIWRPGIDTAVQQVPMALHIHPTADSLRWTWVMVYGEGEQRDERTYELVARGPDKGLYEIDEKNGILLKGYHIQNAFYGLFSVQGSLIMDAYKREGDALIFEILSSQLGAARTTGDTILPGNDTIPPVLDYPVNVVQRAVLHPIP